MQALLTEVAASLYYLPRKSPEAKLWPKRTQIVYKEGNRRPGLHEWAVGGRYSIADIHLLYWRFRGGLDELPTFLNFERHYEVTITRPPVKKTVEAESKVGYELPR